jgi:hypothetical protein
MAWVMRCFAVNRAATLPRPLFLGYPNGILMIHPRCCRDAMHGVSTFAMIPPHNVFIPYVGQTLTAFGSVWGKS